MKDQRNKESRDPVIWEEKTIETIFKTGGCKNEDFGK